MKIQFGFKQFDFKTSFSEFNLKTIKLYMKVHNNIDLLIKDYNDILLKVQAMMPEDPITEDMHLQSKEKGVINQDFEGELYYLDAKLEELQNKIRIERTTLLVSLCNGNQKKFLDFCESTNGMTYGLIKEALRAIFEKLGNLTDYWDECPLIEEFNFRKPYRLLKTKYKIHSMEQTTLIRENLANQQLRAAFNYEDQLINEGCWDNICLFVSTITRPKHQEFEFSFKKRAFMKAKDLIGLNHSERLAYYMEQLEESWEKRADYFSKLPLNIAIGIIKDYWKKKTISKKNTTKFINPVQK